MTKNIISSLTILVCSLLLHTACHGAAPPMVEKHIFLAKPPLTEEDSAIVDIAPVKAKLVFTGVMISDRGRYALIENKIRKPGVKRKFYYTIGETVGEYVLKKIENNYIVLGQDNTNIKFKLYDIEKNRPPPPVVPVVVDPSPQPQAAATGTTTNTGAQAAMKTDANASGNSQGSGQTANAAHSATPAAASGQQPATKTSTENPLANALKKAVEDTRSGNTVQKTNPFLEAIKKARQNSN